MAAAAATVALCPLALALALAQVVICAKASELDTNSNGWRPIPRERVFNWIETPGLHATDGDGLIQVVDGPKVDSMGAGGAGSDVDQGVSIVLPVNRRHFDASSNMRTENRDIQNRRGKKIYFVPNIVSNNIARDKYENTENNEINKEVNNNTYEVFENTTEELVAEQNIITRGDNYDDEEKKGNNLTDNLLKILSNYNIRSDDRLPNYALSLTQKSAKFNGYVYMRVPYRYNSLNHAPVDPLLAVLLSNYGHYIPGLFGVQRNYQNLYGYAASNNIHNNKPFGAYKIFGDTDSAL